MKDEIKILEKQRDQFYKNAEPINKKINELRTIKASKQKKKMVGNCYVFQNSCGMGHWNLYSKIIGYDDDGLIMIKCQKDSDGIITINKSCEYGFTDYLREKKITSGIFDKNYNALLKELHDANCVEGEQ